MLSYAENSCISPYLSDLGCNFHLRRSLLRNFFLCKIVVASNLLILSPSLPNVLSFAECRLVCVGFGLGCLDGFTNGLIHLALANVVNPSNLWHGSQYPRLCVTFYGLVVVEFRLPLPHRNYEDRLTWITECSPQKSRFAGSCCSLFKNLTFL
ncbi:hypothetical protein ACP275_03G056400 [Erythranthe tilingii]